MDNRLAGLIYMMIGIIAYASMPIIIKLALRQSIDPLTLLTARFAIGLVLHWALAGLRRRIVWLPLKLLIRVAILGVLGHAMTSMLVFLALDRVSAAQVALLFATYPSWVTVGDRIVYGIPITFTRAVGLAAALLGSAFLILGDGGAEGGPEINLGSIMALANALLYALYIVLSRHQVRQFSAEVVSPYYATSALVVLLLFRPPWVVAHVDPQLELWTAALFIALTGGFLGVFTFLKALHYISAGDAALIGTLEPAMTVLLAYWILSEQLVGLQWVGLVLVLCGVIIGQIKRRKPAVDHSVR